MFTGFSNKVFKTDQGEIFYKINGAGPPLLMLHGYPQNHFMWHSTAPELAKEYTVIIPDLRGYGKSMAPQGDEDHYNYSKRVMAEDLKGLMNHLNFNKFFLVGHDRGGRVAHRMVRDNKTSILGLIILDICPTLDMYESTNMEFATAYFHWFFLIQPSGIPEKIIELDPKLWLKNCLQKWSSGHDFGEAENEYLTTFSQPDKIHGSCEDYRAGATIDLVHDRQDRHKKINVPVHVLWGSKGFVGKAFNPIEVWQNYVLGEVTGNSLDCGHFIPEEKPNETIVEIKNFFRSISEF